MCVMMSVQFEWLNMGPAMITVSKRFDFNYTSPTASAEVVDAPLPPKLRTVFISSGSVP